MKFQNIDKMTCKGVEYTFSAKVWLSCWYFVSVPVKISTEIRENFKFMEEGWGRLKATAKIGNTEWTSAIWFDTKQNMYLLPIKADIRKKEKVNADEEIEVTIWI